MENWKQFESRKQDHIRLSLDSSHQAVEKNEFDRIQLQHEALPDLNFSDINMESKFEEHTLQTPFLISSMTAGHAGAADLNLVFAEAAQEKGWIMGVGSQRRELYDSSISSEWLEVRKVAPRAVMLANLGISQLVTAETSQIERLIDVIEASGVIIHLNSLQECLQAEGTPQFRGGLEAIEKLIKKVAAPVIIKETGCGISKSTAQRLLSVGVKYLDVSGAGGTHWGRIETSRANPESVQARAGGAFQNWGISTVESVLQVQSLKNENKDFKIWGSGGVRNGVDAAKLLALGAERVGFAKPALQAAFDVINEKGNLTSLVNWMSAVEYELRTAMFCTGSANLKNIVGKIL